MTVGSLFSGIGGLDLGLEWAGFETIWFCEIEDYPRAVLKKHWPNVPIYRDVREINADNAVRPDVIAGGFPCQPFSGAGKRQGTEDDRHLWPEMLRVIRALRPRYVIGENVPGLTNWNGGEVFEQVLSDLEDSDYEVLPPCVLPAAGVGASQYRDRIFIVAHDRSQRRVLQAVSQVSTSKDDGPRPPIGRKDRGQYPLASRRSSGGDGSVQHLLPGPPILATDDDFAQVGGGLHGFSGGLDQYGHRIKGLGNAVVPQVAYVVGTAVMQHASGIA